MTELTDEIDRYINQLSPHIKQRLASKLLIHASIEIERLKADLKYKNHLVEDYQTRLTENDQQIEQPKARNSELKAVVERLAKGRSFNGKPLSTVEDYVCERTSRIKFAADALQRINQHNLST